MQLLNIIICYITIIILPFYYGTILPYFVYYTVALLLIIVIMKLLKTVSPLTFTMAFKFCTDPFCSKSSR